MRSSIAPQPKKILNIAASTSPGMEAIWGNRYAPGTVAYKHEAPETADDQGEILFVEHAPCPMYPLKRALIWCVSIATIVPGLITLPFVIEQGVDLDGVLLIGSMMLIGGFATGACLLWIAWLFRTITLWPLVLVQSNHEIRVQLAHRRPWCMLNTLDPTLAVGKFEWIEGRYGKPIHPRKLPNELHPTMQGCWLKLSYQSRTRWVLLSAHKDEQQADFAVLQWASRLLMNPDIVFTDAVPPKKLVCYWNPKLYGSKE